MLAPSNSYLIMKQDNPLQVQQEGTISVLQGSELGNTKTAAEVKNQPIPHRWGSNLLVFFFPFTSFPPRKCNACGSCWALGTIQAGSDRAPSVCPLWSCSSLEKEKHGDPTSLGTEMLSFKPVALAHQAEGWRSFPVVISFLLSYPVFSTGRN